MPSTNDQPAATDRVSPSPRAPGAADEGERSSRTPPSTTTLPLDPLVVDADRRRDPDGAHGRIGYGHYARFTPVALAALLILSLGAIGLRQRGSDAPAVWAARLTGEPAPDVTLTLLDGTPLRLADLRGSVVVLNFWASWCRPCRDEAPLLQALSDEAARSGEPTVVVGVGVRTDNDADARAFVRELGLTYPIGRDTATDAPGRGPIELTFGIPSAYPATIFIRPDGVVDRYHPGPLTAEQLHAAVAEARGASTR